MRRKIVLCLLATLFSYAMAMAQGTKVTGIVVSAEDGEPIAGASIIGVGSIAGVATDLEGEFTLDLPAGIKQIQVSFIGYETQKLNVRTGKMRIELKEEGQNLEEVVVLAYGTTTARNLTGSVASVRGEALKDIPGNSVDGMLQGRAAGVMINTTSSSIGTAPVINIRGVSSISNSTTPLYVVDGMIFTMDGTSGTRQNPLADLNPADIKSIDILKDAAATALYGSRAANGVVLITTNNSAQGKAKFSYSGSFTLNNATNMFNTMNASEYVDFKNLGVRNTADRRQDGDAFYNKWEYGKMYFTEKPGQYEHSDQGLGFADTKWSDLIFQKGAVQNHDINVQGGNDMASYYVGAGIMDQKGITVGDTFRRFSFSANATIKINKYLKAGFNSSFSNSNQTNVDIGYGSGVYSINGFSRLAAVLPPDIPAYNTDGTPYHEKQYLGYGFNKMNCTMYNPMTYINEQSSNMENNRVRANGYVELTPLTGLTFRTQYGVDWFFTQSGTTQSPNGGDGYSSGGSSSTNDGTRKTWTWTNTLSYNLNVKNHHINVMLGTEAQSMKYRRKNFSASTLNDPEMIFGEASFVTYSGSGIRSERTIASYLSRATWNWNYRYYLEASFRRDGMSSLGRKWGNFWGASASWRISDEKFFQPLKKVFSDLRLKASYGIVGNTSLNGGDYASVSQFANGYYNGTGAYYLSSIADPNLGWEQTAKTDIGITGTIADRFQFELTYFTSTSKNLVLDSSQSYSTGIPGAKITTNLGKAQNRGLEFTISGNIIRSGNFTWESSLNLTWVKNKVLELESDIVEDQTGAANITVEGKSMAQLYVYPTGGIDKETGRRIVYLDDAQGNPTRKALLVYTYGAGASVYDPTSGDKLDINDWNPHLFGNTKPTYYGGWNNTFRFKNWDMTCFFQFSGGNKIYNGTKATLSDYRYWNNSRDVLNNAWRQAGDVAIYAKPEMNDNYSNGSANPISDWVENGDYLRMKTLAIGYTFNTKKWPRNLGISKIRLYASTTNLFCITSYSGLDPEVNSRADISNRASGVDKNTTPLTRSYTFGVNLTF